MPVMQCYNVEKYSHDTSAEAVRTGDTGRGTQEYRGWEDVGHKRPPRLQTTQCSVKETQA